jgi:predicted MPP superfamily phosphohydrolase
MLIRAGFTPLLNEAIVADVEGVRVVVAGAADLWAGGHDARALDRALRPLEADLTLLLGHNPDSKDSYRELPWDLMLAGHTHGGQFVIPLLGAPVVPVRDRRFVAGLHAWSNRWIYVTRGIGNLFGLRLNCRPEITLIEVG